MSILPLPVVWTQRIHDVYLTATVVEPQNVVVAIEPTCITISCSSTSTNASTAADITTQFHVSLTLFSPIDPALSEYITLTRGIRLKLRKLTSGGSRPPFWPRLSKDKTKLAHLTVDWDTWKDEDDLIEEDDDATQGAAFSEHMGFRMSNGTTISGGGDPNAIAEVQRKFLETQRGGAPK
jgi:cytosolic prostaglandin-E synthase